MMKHLWRGREKRRERERERERERKDSEIYLLEGGIGYRINTHYQTIYYHSRGAPMI